MDRLLVLRTAFVLAILAIMPLLALPPVGDPVRRLLSQVVRLVAPGCLGPDQPSLEQPDSVSASALAPLDFTNVSSAGETERRTKAEMPARDPDCLERQWSALLGRLRQLGAARWCLEAECQQAGVLRFECQVPLRESVYRKTFQHSGTDLLTVVEQVVQQVEQWHSARTRLDQSQQETALRADSGLP